MVSKRTLAVHIHCLSCHKLYTILLSMAVLYTQHLLMLQRPLIVCTMLNFLINYYLGASLATVLKF